MRQGLQAALPQPRDVKPVAASLAEAAQPKEAVAGVGHLPGSLAALATSL